MLSQTADHAIRALLVLAREGRGRPLRVEEIAERTGAPRNYLGKTLNALVKDGLLRSARGPTGGFTLVVPIESITVGYLIDRFGETRPAPRCLLGNALCDRGRPCSAHERWRAVLTEARRPLDHTTLAQLLPAEPANATTAGAPAEDAA